MSHQYPELGMVAIDNGDGTWDWMSDQEPPEESPDEDETP